MSGYIGKVQIGTNINNIMAIGSTIYGTCNTSAAVAEKYATITDFDAFIHGVTIRIKFFNGNIATSGLSLQIGDLPAIAIAGNCICGENDVLTFTLDETDNTGNISTNNSNWRWRVNTSTEMATKDYVDSILSSADAMIFKGTIGTNGTATIPTSGYSAGWTYRIITAGTYAGQVCEIGDLLIAIEDATSEQNTINNAHWTVVQGNLEGAVTGPVSSTDTHVAVFDGNNGDVIKDSGYTIGTSVPSNAVFTDHEYTLVTGTNAYTDSEPSDTEGTVLVEVENGVLQLSPFIKFTTTAVGTALATPTNS